MVFIAGGALGLWQHHFFRDRRFLFIQRTRPIFIACIALLLLGIVYGAASDRRAISACQLAESYVGVVKAVHSIQENRVQYFIEDEHCRILLFASRFPLYAAGDRIKVEGELGLLEDFPAELAGYAAYLRQQGVAATMRFPKIEMVKKSAVSNSLAATLRRQVQRVFAEPESAVVLAMTLGQQGEINADVSDQFRRTGVSHILSISGLHISLIAGFIFVTLGLAPVSAAWQTAMSIVVIWLYVGLIEFLPAATRAALFVTIVLLALRLRWLISWPTVLALTVGAMVSVKPALLTSIGFQLSASAVAGMGVMVFLARGGEQEGVRRFLRNAVLVSLGASAATWPLAAYHFGTISVVTLAANLAVVPAASVFLAISLLGLLISFLVPLLGLAASFGIHLLWFWMDWVTQILAVMPAAFFSDVPVSAWMVAVYYLLCAIGADVWIRSQRRSWREVWAQ